MKKTFSNIVQKLAKFLLLFFIWWVLVISIVDAFIFLTTEHYQPKDIPNIRFQVVVSDANGAMKAVDWNAAKIESEHWIRKANQTCRVEEDCLRLMDDSSLLFHNEGALWYSESRYRFDGNKLIPISFVMFTFMHVVLAMFSAFVIFVVAGYIFKRWRWRDLVELTASYNRHILQRLKAVATLLAISVLFYIFVEFIL